MSHPVRGAWIEISLNDIEYHYFPSHPVRGAWIEIAIFYPPLCRRFGRTPSGVRGLKFCMKLRVEVLVKRRTPSGVRGLKFSICIYSAVFAPSHPVRGAWIEMINETRMGVVEMTSHPVRGAWIEIRGLTLLTLTARSRTPSGVRGLKWAINERYARHARSHPVRGAWIEMVVGAFILTVLVVAPRQGCVD